MNLKTIFYVLSILVIAAAAFFGFQNSKKIEEEIATFDDTRSKKVIVQNTITETKSDLDDTETALSEAEGKNSDLTAKLENEQSKNTQMQRTLDGHIATIEEQDQRLANLAEVKAQIEEALKGIQIPWDEIPSKITELQDQRKLKGDDLKQLITLTDKLAAEVESKKEKLAEENDRFAGMKRKIALNAKVGRITAVNTSWGFVIVNLGEDNSNMTPQSELVVTRGGRYIGTLKPTSVELNQTVCDLNLRDLAPGVRLQVGDKVTIKESAGN